MRYRIIKPDGSIADDISSWVNAEMKTAEYPAVMAEMVGAVNDLIRKSTKVYAKAEAARSAPRGGGSGLVSILRRRFGYGV